MVLKGTTRLLETRLRIKGKRGKITEYTRFLIHIPSAMADSGGSRSSPRSLLPTEEEGSSILRRGS